MISSWKSAVLWGILLWVLIFVEISILMFVPSLKDMKIVQTIIHLVILPILVILTSYMYFSKNENASVKEGVLLGIVFFLVGTVLDLSITIPLFVKDYSLFYKSWNLWTGFLELLVFASATGYFIKKSK